MSFLQRLNALLVLALLLSLPMLAQQAGTVQGTVSDETGAIIPGTNVVLDSPAGQKTTTTDVNGTYTFTGLKPGHYTLRVQITGFAKFEKAIDIAPGRTLEVNMPLRVQLANQEVEVKSDVGNTVSVDPTNNAGALVLKGDDLQALSDDPDDLASDLQALAGPAAGPNGGEIFVDGFSGARLPPKESIREIRINSNPFAAEYDRLGFGRIEILTKPGTDKFHGSAMFSDSDSIFNSANPIIHLNPDFHSRLYNGNIGGPLSKKSSFFLDFERRDIGDNAIIDATTVDPTTLAITPFTGAVLTPNTRTSVSPRIDYQLSTNNTLVGRYHFTQFNYDNTGLSDLTLPTQAYNSATTEHELQLTETAVLGSKTIDETRLQYRHALTDLTGNNTLPTINVNGAFVGGGANVGNASTLQNNWELTNTVSRIQGKHSIKFGGRMRNASLRDVSPRNFGGTFIFGGGFGPELDANNQPVLDASGNPVVQQLTAIERYRRTLLFQNQGISIADMQKLGGGPTQFSISGGSPLAKVNQFDIGLFVQDDWRLKPNFTLSLGLRYENQTNISDNHDFGPRIGFAWAPGSTGGKPGKTVIRGGVGMFYDRFADTYYLDALRFNGSTQTRYVVPNPLFFPTVPSIADIAGFQVGQTITRVDPNLRAPYIIQSAIGVERQLPRNTTLAVTFTQSRGVHMLRSRNISAPLNPVAATGTGSTEQSPTSNVVYEYESSGILNQNQLITNVNTRFSRKITLFTYYVFNHANSNTDNASTFPANQYDLSTEYGRASYDVRHRFMLGGSITAPWNLRFSPFVIARSGSPFNIVLGRDLNGDQVFTDRPALAADPNAAGMIHTDWGVFDPNPVAGETIIPRNFGEGPGYFSVNLRVSKTFGFGESRSGGNAMQPGGGGDHGPGGGGRYGGPGGPGGMRMGGGGGGRGGMFGGESTDHRYNLTLSGSARNLFNTVNFGQPIGDLSSPNFGKSTSLAGGFGPGGGVANNRRIDLQLRFTF